MRKNIVLVAAAIVLALALGACSDDDGGIKVCQPTCAANADCTTGLVCDTANAKCVQCVADADCTGDLKKGGCDTAKNICKQCKADGDCPTPTYKGCDTGTGMCKMCASDTDCEISSVKIMTGKCDTSKSWMCLKCTADADCTGFTGSTYKRCGSAGYCVMCKDNADCDAGKECNTTYEMCMSKTGCTSDAECTPLKCNTAKGYCECTDDAVCQSKFGTLGGKWACKSM